MKTHLCSLSNTNKAQQTPLCLARINPFPCRRGCFLWKREWISCLLQPVRIALPLFCTKPPVYPLTPVSSRTHPSRSESTDLTLIPKSSTSWVQACRAHLPIPPRKSHWTWYQTCPCEASGLIVNGDHACAFSRGRLKLRLSSSSSSLSGCHCWINAHHCYACILYLNVGVIFHSDEKSLLLSLDTTDLSSGVGDGNVWSIKTAFWWESRWEANGPWDTLEQIVVHSRYVKRFLLLFCK